MAGALSLPTVDVDIYLDESYLIEEDFEQWNNNSWTVQLNEAGRFYISGGAAYRGAFGMACVTAWSLDTDREQAMITKSFTNDSDAVVYLSFRLRFTESISNGAVSLVEFTESTSLRGWLNLVDTNGTHNLKLLSNDGENVLLTAKALYTGVWYQVKIGFKAHSTTGVEYVEVDGVVLRNFTGLTDSTDANTVNRVYIGIDTWFSEQSCIGYYDNIRLKLADINVNYTIYDETILALSLHLGTTKEVSSFEIVVDRGNPDYDNTLDPGEVNALATGYEADIFLGRGSNKPLLLTGQIEEVEYIDELDDFEFRNVVVIRGRCKGYQLFGRKYDGDLITAVGTTTRNYERTSGDASSLVAYLIDNYTSLTHFRGTGAMAANANISQKNVTVRAGQGATFTVGDLIRIGDELAWEYNRVASISTDTLTMVYNLLANYTTAKYGYVLLDLIKKTDTAYTKMDFIDTTIYEIIKFIADSADTGGTIGYDFRVEYDGNFAFVHLSAVAEGYNLSDECQLHRYIKDAKRVKNKITVKGKADKPYPLDSDGLPYSDGWTELATPAEIVAVVVNVAASQADVEVAEGTSSVFSANDWIWITDDVGGNNEIIQIDSIALSGGSNDVITMKTDFVSAYTTANFALMYTVSTTSRWGFEPIGAADDISIVQETTTIVEGSKSVEVVGVNSISDYNVLCNLLGTENANMNDYPTLKMFLHFVTTAPATILFYLYSGTAASSESAYYLTSIDSPSADQWMEINIKGGTDNVSSWSVGGSFDWTDICAIKIRVIYTGGGNNTFYIDRLHFFGKRWGDGSDHGTIDGFAEDTTSQTTYGIREHVHVSDLLLSDAECEYKALALLNYYKTERLTIEVGSDTLDWTTYHPTPANTTGLDLDQLGVTGSSYRIDSIDILYRSADNSLLVVYVLGNPPLKQADYLYELGKVIVEIRKNYSDIR